MANQQLIQVIRAKYQKLDADIVKLFGSRPSLSLQLELLIMLATKYAGKELTDTPVGAG